MRYNTKSKTLRDAFGIVKAVDPRLFATMDAADWTVTTDPDPVINLFKDDEFRNAVSDVVYGFTGTEVFGLTASDNDPSTPTKHPASYIDTRACAGRARSLHVTTAHFTAMILAHEFAHIHDPAGHTEKHAYKAGGEFAALLPAPDGPMIKSYSDYIASQNA